MTEKTGTENPGRRIVVIGHGMVGSRFLHDLSREAQRTGAELTVTALGAEPYPAYNRLLLSDVLAARAEITALTLPAPPAGHDVRLGVCATHIDRAGSTVHADDGTIHPYDTLVLATGADAHLPDIAGAYDDGQLARGVRVLRTMDDCRGLLAAAGPGRHAVVAGGGVLGLEAACGLRSRGMTVTVIQGADRVMNQQLDADSAAVAGATLGDLGIAVVTGVRPIEVHRRDDGTLRRVRLTDGTTLPADLLLLSAGTVPRTELARDAGLTVGRGIVVGDDLRSPDDPRITAIGDCAETTTGCPGVVAPGWRQAAALARRLVTETVDGDLGNDASRHPDGPAEAPERTVIRLKARGLDAVSLGPAHLLTGDEPGVRVIALSDPVGRRSTRIATDGDRLLAAACVGDPKVAAALTVAYEQGSLLPADPAALLLPAAAPAARAPETPMRLPDSATLCRCNGVTKGQVIAAYRDGSRSLADLAGSTRAATGCGGCAESVEGVLDWLIEADPEQAGHPAQPVRAPGEQEFSWR